MKGAVVCGLLLLGLVACSQQLSYSRELEDMALMRSMGVDVAEEGKVEVTLSTGVGGGTKGETTPLVLSGTGESVAAGCETIQGLGSAYVYFGHVGQLLLGEDVAEGGIDFLLDYVQGDDEMRLDTTLYILKEREAKDTMTTLASQGTSVPDRLDAMESEGVILPAFTPVTLRQVIAQTNRSGSVAVPALSLTEEGTLVADGFAIIKEGALVGYVQGDGALGVDLVREEVYGTVADVQGATLRLMDSDVTITPEFQDDVLIGQTISCTVKADLIQQADGTTLEEVEAALSQKLEGQIQEGLAQMVALGADFLELQLAATMACPGGQEAILSQWSLENTILSVELEVEITNSY